MFLKNSLFAALPLLLFTLIIFTGKTYAQLDPTFGANGVVRTALGGEGTTIAQFVLPDGKILIVATERIGGQRKTVFIRYNSDGTLDANYGTNGKVRLPIPYLSPNTGITLNAARQPDGKIVIVGGDFFGIDWVALVARFNEDGTLDTTFAQGNGISRPNPTQSGDDRFNSVILQPDGKILVVGSAEVSGTPYLLLMRYNSDGTVDASFGNNNTGYVIHTALGSQWLGVGQHSYLQSSGKFIVGVINNLTGQGIYRFNIDGTIDGGFTPLPNSSVNFIQLIHVQPDDKILVGGQVSKTEILETQHLDARLNRYHADGTVDASFGNAGQVSFDTAGYSDDYPKGLQVMPDGQILVALNLIIQSNRGIYNGSNWLALARLSANGTVGGRFLVAPFNQNSISYSTVQPDGKILVATRGNIESPSDGVVKLARVVDVPPQKYVFHANPGFLPNYYVYRPSTNRLYSSTNNYDVGLAPGDILAPGDFIGSSFGEFTYFRPSTGTWHISRSLSATDILTIRWGMEGDVPAPADYDGDGKDDPAVFRPADGYWYIYHIADGSSSAVKWGIEGDKAVAGDYDGDGTYDRAVFRPASGEWWILRSSDNGYTLVQFGLAGDVPVQEDYDGDGKFDIAVYRPSTGEWFRINSSDASVFAFQWGLPGDVPVPGDYDRDQKANVAVWRPVNGAWYIVNPNYTSMFSYNLGMNGDRPIPGRY